MATSDSPGENEIRGAAASPTKSQPRDGSTAATADGESLHESDTVAGEFVSVAKKGRRASAMWLKALEKVKLGVHLERETTKGGHVRETPEDSTYGSQPFYIELP